MLPVAALDTRSSIFQVLGSRSKSFDWNTPRPLSRACFTTNVKAPSTRAALRTDAETEAAFGSVWRSSVTVRVHQSRNGA